MPSSASPNRTRRIVVIFGLIVLGIMLLPITAFMLDVIDENLIAPVHVALMLAAGAAVWNWVPGMAAPESSTGRRVAVGAAIGFGAALAAYALFFLLLSGFSGA